MMQQYCGDNTMIATLVLLCCFPVAACCVPCCKCDSRMVYDVGGVKYMPNGAQAPPDCC